MKCTNIDGHKWKKVHDGTLVKTYQCKYCKDVKAKQVKGNRATESFPVMIITKG